MFSQGFLEYDSHETLKRELSNSIRYYLRPERKTGILHNVNLLSFEDNFQNPLLLILSIVLVWGKFLRSSTLSSEKVHVTHLRKVTDLPVIWYFIFKQLNVSYKIHSAKDVEKWENASSWSS